MDGISEDYKQNIFVIFSDALAKLNKTLVFEGVENETQYRFIANRYPDALIQGWYFSKALTRSELAKRLTGVAPNLKPVLLVFTLRTFPFFRQTI